MVGDLGRSSGREIVPAGWGESISSLGPGELSRSSRNGHGIDVFQSSRPSMQPCSLAGMRQRLLSLDSRVHRNSGLLSWHYQPLYFQPYRSPDEYKSYLTLLYSGLYSEQTPFC